MASDAASLWQKLAALRPRLILSLVRRGGIPRDEADDVVQEVLVRLVERAGQDPAGLPFDLDDEAALVMYALRTSLNRYRDHLRHQTVRRFHEAALIQALDVHADAEQRVLTLNRIEALQEVLPRLESPYRELFAMLLQEELPLAEIARRLDRSLGTIYTQFHRGLRQLRVLLDREELSRKDRGF